jgi:hypothetical protein
MMIIIIICVKLLLLLHDSDEGCIEPKSFSHNIGHLW